MSNDLPESESKLPLVVGDFTRAQVRDMVDSFLTEVKGRRGPSYDFVGSAMKRK